jgi:hypothetical protein
VLHILRVETRTSDDIKQILETLMGLLYAVVPIPMAKLERGLIGVRVIRIIIEVISWSNSGDKTDILERQDLFRVVTRRGRREELAC